MLIEQIASGPAWSPATQAGHTYRANCSRLGSLVRVAVRSVSQSANEVYRSLYIEPARPLSSEQLKAHAELADAADGTFLLHEWAAVMLVTFAETYLQDVLVECAKADASLLGEAKPVATFEAVNSSCSLDELREEMLYQWARTFVDDGGPTRWMGRLERMGVSTSKDNLRVIEELWGVRHLSVHRAGVVSADFSRRYPSRASRAGERIILNHPEVIAYFEAVHGMLRPIDEAFAARIHAKSQSRAGAV